MKSHARLETFQIDIVAIRIRSRVNGVLVLPLFFHHYREVYLIPTQVGTFNEKNQEGSQEPKQVIGCNCFFLEGYFTLTMLISIVK